MDAALKVPKHILKNNEELELMSLETEVLFIDEDGVEWLFFKVKPIKSEDKDLMGIKEDLYMSKYIIDNGYINIKK